MNDQDPNSTRQTRLNEIIAEYFAAVEAGNPPDHERFVEQHGPFAADLREFFNDGQMFERMARTLSIAPGAAKASARLVTHGERIRYFGDYELEEELARGGMGIVFKARQISLNRLVALKMILSGQFASSAEVLRFGTEAESAAALDHPNIVPIYEVGEHHGQHYFTMKLIDGGNIEQWARSSVPDQRQIAAMMATVARAVHFGHQRGILHRDLKPGNVLVDKAGVAYVVDFGIAKRVEADQDLTRTTDVMGSPAYMSPEQAAGRAREISVATDVYGLGAILYCLLTSRPPFVAESAGETLRLVLTADPARPSTVRPGIDPDLQTICLKCLQKDPAKRYASAQAMADDLQRWLDGKPIIARPASQFERVVKWAKRRPSLAALVGVSIALLAVLVWVLPVSYLRVRAALSRETEAHHQETLAMRENRDRLVQTSITRGLEAMAAGDHGAALIWWANALRDETDPQRQRVLRTRITLGLGQMPRIRQLLNDVTPLCFTDDGKNLVGFAGNAMGTECRAYRDFQGSTLTRVDLTHPRRLSKPPVLARPTGFIGSIQNALSKLRPAASGPTIPPDPTVNVGQGAVFTDITTPVTRLARTNNAPGGATLTFWDVPQMKAMGTTTTTFSNPARHICYSVDGNRAAVLVDVPPFNEKTQSWIHCFDVNTGVELGPPISNISVRWIQLDAKGNRIATVSNNEHSSKESGVRFSAGVWDIASGKSFFSVPFGPSVNDPNSADGQAIFSPDASRLLTVWGTGATAAMRTWDLHAGKPLSDEQFLSNLNIGSDPSFIAPVGGFIGNETLWISQRKTVGFRNTQGGQPDYRPEFAPQGGVEEMQQIASSPDGRILASAARLEAGNAVSYWDAADHHLIATQIMSGTWLSRVLFSPNSQRMAIASSNYPPITQVRDTTPPAEQSSYPQLFKGWGIVLALSRDGQRAVSEVQQNAAGGSYMLRITDLQSGKSTQVPSPVGNVTHASFSPDGSRIAIAGQFSSGPFSAAVLRADDGKVVLDSFQPWAEESTSECYFISFTSDGKWIVIEFGKRGDSFSSRRAWNAKTGAKLDFPDTAGANLSVVNFSDDSRLVLLADHPRSNFFPAVGVRVWDVAQRKPVSPALMQGVESARISPDDRCVLIYGRDKSGEMPLTLYEIATGRQTWSVTIAIDDCYNLTFSPDGSKIAVAGDKATEMRAASDGQLIAPPIDRGVGSQGFDPMSSMKFTADGLFLIFWRTQDPRGVQIFDTRTGELVASFSMPMEYRSKALPVFPSAGRMLLIHDDKPVEIRFAPDERDVDTLESVVHLLSGRKLDANGALAPLSVEEVARDWDELIAAHAPELGEKADEKQQ